MRCLLVWNVTIMVTMVTKNAGDVLCCVLTQSMLNCHLRYHITPLLWWIIAQTWKYFNTTPTKNSFSRLVKNYSSSFIVLALSKYWDQKCNFVGLMTWLNWVIFKQDEIVTWHRTRFLYKLEAYHQHNSPACSDISHLSNLYPTQGSCKPDFYLQKDVMQHNF